ncbi:MAG: cytochrome c oxidase subunit [Actinomycetota bacterium]|jgi:cytochrome c oxidase subunit 2|nr:cytochrome c oxidase subunit [Actinomycetota bacterium]
MRLSPTPARRARLGAAVLALLLLATGCARETMPQDVLSHPQGPIARRLEHLINPVFLIAAFFFVLVQGLVIYAAIRFRRRSDDEAPVQVHGSAKLELTWTVVPAVLLLGVGIFTLANLFFLDQQPKGPDVVQVDVIGHQWWWEFKYPQYKITTANELHIPAGKKVAIKMTSTDVIHSFWPPKLAGKVDVIPGRTNHMVIEADAPGNFFGQCAEFCGLSHANMRLRVIADSQADFDTWVADQTTAAALPVTGDAAAGAALFRSKGCSGCHTVDGYSAGLVGPNLTHFNSRARFAGYIFDNNDEMLRKWLRNPPAMKPMNPNKGLGMPNLHLSEDEITKLIAYLDSLK